MKKILFSYLNVQAIVEVESAATQSGPHPLPSSPKHVQKYVAMEANQEQRLSTFFFCTSARCIPDPGHSILNIEIWKTKVSGRKIEDEDPTRSSSIYLPT